MCFYVSPVLTVYKQLKSNRVLDRHWICKKQPPIKKKIPPSEVFNFKGSASLGNRQEIEGQGWWEGQHGEQPGRTDMRRACGKASVEFSLERPSLTLPANPVLTH